MNRTHMFWGASCIAVALAIPVSADDPIAASASEVGKKAGAPSAPLWSDRGDIRLLNLFFGPGGEEHQPAGKFTFVKEDKEGTSPKFDVVDEQGEGE